MWQVKTCSEQRSNQVHLPNPELGRPTRYGSRGGSGGLCAHASYTGWHHHDQDQAHHHQDQDDLHQDQDDHHQDQDAHPIWHKIKWFTGCMVRPGLGEGHCQGEVLLIASTCSNSTCSNSTSYFCSEQSPPTEPPISTFLKLFHPNTLLAGCFLLAPQYWNI